MYLTLHRSLFTPRKREVGERADVSTSILIRSGAHKKGRFVHGSLAWNAGDSPGGKIICAWVARKNEISMFSQPHPNCGNNEMSLFYYYFF